MLEYVLYLLSISLQASGAAMVSLYWFKNKDSIISNEYHKLNSSKLMILITEGKEEKLKLDKEKLEDTIIQVQVNRFSFLMMMLGTIIGILGEQSENNCYTLLWVILLSFAIGYIVNKIIRKMVKMDLENEKYWDMIIQESVPDGTIGSMDT